MRVSLARDSSETIEVIIIELGTVTVSDMRMHHVLIIVTLSEGHTDLNHENNKCLIISEERSCLPSCFSFFHSFFAVVWDPVARGPFDIEHV